MRLWHLSAIILMLGLVMAIARDPVGCVALIVFVTGLGEVILGTTAIMALFQTIGALGMARGLLQHGQAVAATTFVLVLATGVMSLWLFVGAWLVRAALP